MMKSHRQSQLSINIPSPNQRRSPLAGWICTVRSLPKSHPQATKQITRWNNWPSNVTCH